MPTSSQSQILSVVDYQLLQQQQQAGGQNSTAKPPVRISVNQATSTTNESRRRHQKEDRRTSIGTKTDDDNHSPTPYDRVNRRRSSDKTNDNLSSSRTTQRNDILHIPVVNINQGTRNELRTKSSNINVNDNRQTRTYTYGQRKSLASDNDDQYEIQQNFKHVKYITPSSYGEYTTSASDLDNTNEDDDYDDENGDENGKGERRSSLLNENARRLLLLGTIRPSRTFYKNLPESDVEHLMEYFRRMKNTQRKMTSDEINQELATKIVEYKPKFFFDSACVTKTQVANIEKLLEQYADKIRGHKAEFVKLENPMRFVIKPVDNDTPLTTIPREYNDCFITLVTRSDPLRKSDLVTSLVQEKFTEDVKANSLDISYFPGGVNYDVPRDDIDENGEMKLETYQKLKKRLTNRKVWYFSDPPVKKPNAFLAILPTDLSISIDHQRLYDALHERLKSLPADGNSNNENRIVSIEFVALSCILSSHDISNQFIVDCDTIETKRHLMEQPLKIVANKQSIIVELQSHDENMQREYEKFIKAEKYRELIKNHDVAIKRKTHK